MRCARCSYLVSEKVHWWWIRQQKAGVGLNVEKSAGASRGKTLVNVRRWEEVPVKSIVPDKG